MAQTPKAQPSALLQDLLRGIRWGTILLLVMLLGITAYRVLSSSEAAASQPNTESESTPTPQVNPPGAIQIGEAVMKGPDAPAAPEPAKPRKAPVKTTPQVEEPEHIQAPKFAPPPVLPAAKPVANSFVAEPVPEAAPTAPAEVAVPTATAVPAPPPTVVPADNSKQGNRATRAVRSVGRIFGFGRKAPASKDPSTK